MASRDLIAASGGFNRMVLGREGYIVYNPNDTCVGRSIELYGEYGEGEAEALRQLLPPGGVAVEAGANIGTLTLVLAKAAGPAGRVYAIEPQRVLHQALCANLALNSIVNVEAIHAAAGAQPGWLRVPELDYRQPFNYGALEMTSAQDGEPVRRITLDELPLTRLDLLKADVEGMELEVLRGADAHIRKFQPILYVENDRVAGSEALVRHIQGLGYRLYWHSPALFNPANFFANPENVFGAIVSLNMLCVPRGYPREVAGSLEITDPTRHPLAR